jgi:hypothetical protein
MPCQPSGPSNTCAILFRTAYCIHDGHERMLLTMLSSAGRISCPLRPASTCFTISRVTSSISRTGSVKPGFARSSVIKGVRIHPGFTTLEGIQDASCNVRGREAGLLTLSSR